ncbi:hypothetical protein I302_109071 [Kwoniella bestiolae CBS 10118]|uniref:Uncharacterized protein n=1 Tax=Kwoniella bestiolae CBS 10118 TaxID=1296100 RepID=A0A1B9FUY2_9TREE|nr:hypothetical protein I302_08215 [Kwoniella bestiolae CBS 10118]OCF22565.1 hypothetical protein I302_08215 [Kwoniella bestiolae CBS 10118]
MLYAFAFLILIIIILLVWLIRVLAATNQRRKARKDPSVLPSQIQDLNHRPTFAEAAEEVTDRMRPHHRPRGSEPFTPYQSRYTRERSDVGAVTRVMGDNASVTSLPAYGAASLPVPPAAIYDPTRARLDVPPSALPSYPDVSPPKYSEGTSRSIMTTQ